MTTRRATLADAAAVAALHLASWRSAYRPFLPPGVLDALSLDAHTATWERRAGIPRVEILLEEERGTLIAFCAHGPSGDEDAGTETWEIKNLHVDPARRRTGSGGRLFDLAVAHARREGARALTLWVVEANASARAFYQKKGMAPDGARDTHTLGADGSMPVVRYRLVL
ncbi:MAG TPA: GNAT family N-acetyltransferase [Gemmatimonadales bacterium]|nr:GNAT family N-acetyltransferase [Gemmatimonadales bacterium]